MRLTPPTIPVFLIAVILAVLSFGSLYTHLPSIQGVVAAHRYGMMTAAFVILALGVIFSGL